MWEGRKDRWSTTRDRGTSGSGGADVPHTGLRCQLHDCVSPTPRTPHWKGEGHVRKLHLSLYKGEKMGPTKEERYDVETRVILPADRNHKTKEITMVIKSSSESLEAPGQDRRKTTLCPRGAAAPASAASGCRKSQLVCPGWQKLATRSSRTPGNLRTRFGKRGSRGRMEILRLGGKPAALSCSPLTVSICQNPRIPVGVNYTSTTRLKTD